VKIDLTSIEMEWLVPINAVVGKSPNSDYQKSQSWQDEQQPIK